MKITYDEPGFDQLPAKPGNGQGFPDTVSIAEGYGATQDDLQRGSLDFGSADPKAPRSPDIYRTPVLDRHIQRRDWYDQGNPQFEALMNGIPMEAEQE